MQISIEKLNILDQAPSDDRAEIRAKNIACETLYLSDPVVPFRFQGLWDGALFADMSELYHKYQMPNRDQLEALDPDGAYRVAQLRYCDIVARFTPEVTVGNMEIKRSRKALIPGSSSRTKSIRRKAT